MAKRKDRARRERGASGGKGEGKLWVGRVDQPAVPTRGLSATIAEAPANQRMQMVLRS